MFGPSGRLHAVEKVFERATCDVGVDWKGVRREFMERDKLSMPGRLALGVVGSGFVVVVCMDLLGVDNVYVPPLGLVEEDGVDVGYNVSLREDEYFESLLIRNEDGTLYGSMGGFSRLPAFVQVDKATMATTAGDPIDASILIRRIEDLARHHHEMQGIPGSSFLLGVHENSISAKDISRDLADILQISTQSIGGNVGRMLAVR